MQQKDLAKLVEFTGNLDVRVGKVEEDMGFKSYFNMPLTIKSEQLPYE